MNAFPSPRDPKTGSDDKGMSLRDYFAAHAMQGLLTAEIVGEYTNEHVAEIAYRIADSMMEARSL